MDTESKLNCLKKDFPDFDIDSLFEILISCDGSVKKAKSLLKDEQYTLDGHHDEAIHLRKDTRTITNAYVGEEAKANHENTEAETVVKHVDSDQIKNEEELSTTNKRRKLDNTYDSNIGLSRIIRLPQMDELLTDKTITLFTKYEIESVLPNIRIFRNFLPKELSEELLDSMMQQKLMFKAKKFYIAGNLCTSSQKSLCFSENGNMDYDPVYTREDMKPAKMTSALRLSRIYIDDKVNTILTELYGKKEDKLDYMITKNWKSDFCLANYFPNNKSHLDWHTDKLTNIGPLPTIASISIGAARMFRLRRSNPTNSAIYSIPLHHNTLLIMLPSTQELFKHCVPTLKDSLIKKHFKVGDSRFSLTFRMQYPNFEQHKVFCDICKMQMILRRLFKGNDIGYYYWQCMGSFKGKKCSGFKYAKFDGSLEFDTKDKNKATRWLSPSEHQLIN